MRYFLEVAYKGTRYSGFQVQQNAHTVQGEIEKAFQIFFHLPTHSVEQVGFKLTGSSRTDAGVHAYQNFFHFDWPDVFQQEWTYNLNAILPNDIVVKNIIAVADDAHCRFDALYRTYQYHIYQSKNPFIADRSYYYPYTLNIEILNKAAAMVKNCTDFTSFSKRNTQVNNFNCKILQSEWVQKEGQIIYIVSANRFLRGMVRALTATMLKAGRSIISLDELLHIMQAKDSNKAWFDTPAHGLTLMEVKYP